MRCAVIIQSLATVLSVQSSLGDGAINYCGARMCAHTDTHTFCRYPPGPDPACVGYIDARLSDEEKLRVLARLNRRRSEVARGLAGLPPAGDMLKLRWVEELAREAQRWADQCQPPSTPEYYDGCRDLYAITVGQCVASVVGEAPGLRCETMVDVWHMQSRLYKGRVTSYAPYKNYITDLKIPIATTETLLKWFGRGPTWWDAGEVDSWFVLIATELENWAAGLQVTMQFLAHLGQRDILDPTPWHGRLRSIERLVCNFAPRGPAPQRSIWSPGNPASACPARSRPDTEVPALCAYHYAMDETYDEDNTMSLEEHLLLNTVLEIERNATLDHIGSIDELYLTKLAVATIENPVVTSPSYTINVQKRDAIKKVDIEIKNTKHVNKSYFEKHESAITESNRKFYKSLKRKGQIVGRPKTYNMDDLTDSKLNDMNTNNYDKIQETTTMERDINYDDYDAVGIQEETTTDITASTIMKDIQISSAEAKEKEDNNTTVNIETIPYTTIPQNMPNSISTESFGMFLNDMISNLTIPEILNESAIDANVLDDYLSDPETILQLQEALDQMERKAAFSPSTSGKVRRELRNLQDTDEQKRNNHIKEGTKFEDLSEIERNKTIDRGPMLSMVLKYMPYLKPYEKSIIGNQANTGTFISPSFILFIVLYF